MNLLLTKRISELDKSIQAIETVKMRISYFLEPLDGIMAFLRLNNELFYSAVTNDFMTEWRNTFTAVTQSIKKDEKAMLSDFAVTLGKSDRDGQIALCEEMRDRIIHKRQKAIDDKEKFSRLALTLPVFAGLSIILLFA